MIRSMTGFGKAEVTINSKKITVEIRTLNSKQLDLSLRIPSLYRSVEVEIRNIIARGVVRGKCEVQIAYSSIGAGKEMARKIDKELFASYYNQISDLCFDNGFKCISSNYEDHILPTIMRMPDIVTVQEESVAPEECQAVVAAVGEAIDHLNEFREQEGAILIADLLQRIEKIEAAKESVTPFEEARVETVKSRIRENIAKLQVNVDSNRLEAEMIFYAEKLDITEEKVRLTNHCKYFREVAASEEGVGRKLGFISQEIGREINTMGSKANESNIQRIVVEMKDELEKIKEQSLNIL
ncbi:MAG: YicC/YloC family endoribonuclease [Rikenellaceae bacterium]